MTLDLEGHLSYALAHYYPSLTTVPAGQLLRLLTGSKPMSSDQLLQAASQLVPGLKDEPLISSVEPYLITAYCEWGRLWMFYQQFKQLTLQHRCVVAWRQRVIDDIARGKMDGNVLTAMQRLTATEQKLVGFSSKIRQILFVIGVVINGLILPLSITTMADGAEVVAAPAEPVAVNEQGVDNQEAPPAPETSWTSVSFRIAAQMAVFYLVQVTFMGPNRTAAPINATAVHEASIAQGKFSNRLVPGQLFDLHVTFSTEHAAKTDTEPFWALSDLEYGDFTAGELGDGSYFERLTVPVPLAVQNNATWYAHVAIIGQPQCARRTCNAEALYLNFTQPITIYMPLAKNITKRNLLRDTPATETAIVAADDAIPPIVVYYHENITITLLDPGTLTFKPTELPEPLRLHFRFNESSQRYLPAAAVDRFWQLGSDYFPLNSTTPEVHMRLAYQPVGMFRWQLEQQMTESWRVQVGLA